ncbi:MULTISPECIES: Hsp70 family protein [Rhizobium]|uniref:Hsp70 family protein n=1 Tax=Rhizobium TaxID=379 RepID=UPI000645F5B9|nr:MULTISPECIES: Hsp70 family protein [Rhizobium]KZS52918.1 molecular chaperone Hsp70 [Rhizobium anhuiense bv. trifolii]MBB3303371.1 putative chaperone protein [Rhizobium sp. BK112]MBB3372490.1 putative chaperone protein [Rhizobium sp. BK077]MBB4183221.1 putative chaperone protein [Rhizobium sp. BK109]NKM53336.1 Hsp70 family protein [Rhizobium anhuiense]
MAQALGFDFGTTNTVLALADGGATRSMAFTSTEGTADSMRTALSFMKDAQLGASALKVEAGHAAIRQFIDNPGECRFLQSIKTFAASALFQGTLIFAKRHNFEDLMEIFIRRLRNYAGDNWPSQVSRIVTGRPVHFAGASPDPALATERYNEALSRFGFPEIHYVYEPVAAAFYFAQNLKQDATVLVADFGGGTTDYSLIRFETVAGKLTATPIGHSGVGVAGDHFDYRMIDNIVAPLIGKGSHFKSFDKILEVPSNYYSSFGRWNQLSIFKTTREFEDLKKLVRTSLEPEKLEIFIDLIDHDEGYPLYQAVSATKMALSASEEAPFDFAPLGRGGRRSIKRSDFEGWIAEDLARIEGALDDVLEKTETKPSEIDKVFLTGGTSFVPAVRRIFTERFERDRIESGGELLSIAHGLALIGERDDIGQWTVQ